MHNAFCPGLTFDEQRHEYTIDGTVLPSVTTIIQPIRFIKHGGAVDSYARMMAAERGTRVHEACLAYDFDPSIELDADILPYVEAYATFKRDYGVTDWMHYELPLGNLLIGYAGTVDRIGIIDGEITVVDLKSGASVDKHMLQAQLSAYALLARSCNIVIAPLPSIKLIGLQLRNDGKYTVRPCEYDTRIFFACLNLRQRIIGGGKAE